VDQPLKSNQHRHLIISRGLPFAHAYQLQLTSINIVLELSSRQTGTQTRRVITVLAAPKV